MIEIKNISKTIGKRKILNSISFSMSKGEKIALLGESGSGKSTIARIIMGLMEASSGEIEMDGQVLSSGTKKGIRKKIGYVIQSGGLFPHLTARQNIEIAVREKISREQLEDKIDHLLGIAHIAKERLKNYPCQLSGGEKQRVAIMRALINEPDIMVLDEPLGALDPITRARLQKELKELFLSLEMTVIIVTHDISEAEHFSDRVVLLRNGQVEQVGPFKDLLENPRSLYVENFVGSQS